MMCRSLFRLWSDNEANEAEKASRGDEKELLETTVAYLTG